MTVLELKKYKDSLYNSLCRDLSDFEKNFLLIAGGLLAFSITFIKEIIKIEEAKFLILLFIAWSFIILAIGIMMFTFLKSATASDKLWFTVDNLLIEHLLYQDDQVLQTDQITLVKTAINKVFYQSKRSLKRLRFSAVSIFICGLVLFATFVAINLLREKKNSPNVKDSVTVSISYDSLKILLNQIPLNKKNENKNPFSNDGAGAKTNTPANTNTDSSTTAKADSSTAKTR